MPEAGELGNAADDAVCGIFVSMSFRTPTACLLAVVAFGAVACGSASEPAPPPATPAPQPAAQDHYSGHWRGVARITTSMPDAPSEMGIEATIAGGGGRCATIEYGAIGCSGVWTCTSAYDAPVMVIQETIRFGQEERCPTNARVELRRTEDPDVLQFRYSSPVIQGEGTLSRVALR